MGQLFMGVSEDSVYKGDFQFMGRLFIGADGDIKKSTIIPIIGFSKPDR